MSTNDNLYQQYNFENVIEKLGIKYNISINIKEYKNYTKKLTGYILFSKEEYKKRMDNVKINSKIISQKWKKLCAEEKEFYILYAYKLCKKKMKRKKSKKIKKKILKNNFEINKNSFKYTETKITNVLKSVIIDEKSYIVDCFDNIITEDGKDIGYINYLNEVIIQ